MVHTASHTTASSMTPAYAMLPSAVMLLLLMHLLLLQSGSGFAQTGNEPPSMVTSGATCLSDADCPKNRYCQPDSMRCLVRIGEKGECDILGADGECAEGLHCTFGESYRESRCLPQGDMGDICRVDATQPCKAGLLCDADTARCRESNATPDGDEQQHDGGGDDSLLRNDPCVRDEDCGARQRAGFFCAPGGRCVRRRPEGAQCRDHAQCIGFCAGSDGAAGGNGMCRPHQAVGAACGANDHCAHVGAVPARYAVLCNMPEDGTKGVCLSANQLLRALGTTCNPNKDACDARRGLSCQRVGSASFGRFACVQRGQRSAMYCAPAGKKGSEFSGCPLALETGVPATCRRTRAPMRPGFFRCLRRVETVPRGAVCSPRGEHVACAEGTTCSAVPGTGVRACVAAVARGADCSNKFATTCADGLACVDGTCVPGAPSTPRQRTHADLGEDCSALPCVPGTRCETSTGKNTKLCALPRVTVVKGKPCYATARFNKVCANGLVCSQDANGEGVAMCREPLGAGAVCASNATCAKALKCSASGVCYDPARALRQGNICDPAEERAGPLCVAATDDRPLVCAPRPGRSGRFVCQVIASLFQPCSAARNVACAPGLVCDQARICAPA